MRFAASSQRLIRAFVTLGIFALPAVANAGQGVSVPAGLKWDPWVELGGLWNDDNESRGVIEFWLPLMQGPRTVFFADGRGSFYEHDVQAGNIALAYRHMLTSGWNLGVWGGVGGTNTEVDNTFWQLSGGLEALSANWDLRLNGYLPVTDPQSSPSLAEVRLRGHNIFMIGAEEVALSGFDGEIGYRVFGKDNVPPGTRHLELRVYGGGFWFDDDDALHEIAGPKARAELRLEDVIESLPRSRLTAEVAYSNDDVRDDVWEVGGRLRIPFGGGAYAAARRFPLTGQEKRMSERIERDDIITTQSDKEKVEDALTDVNFDRVAFVNDGGSITTTSTNAGSNSLIIAKGGTITGPQELQGNQTLQGGGSTIQVRGLKTGTVTNFTAPGSRPTLFNNEDSAVLTLLGSNTHVTGLDIVGAGQGSGFGENRGIFGDTDLDNMFIVDVAITEVGDDGIFFGLDNSVTVTIADAEISNTGGIGIHLRDNNTVKILDTEIRNTGGSGIFINSFNRVTITNTTISDTEFDGVHLDSFNTAKIAGLEISNTGAHGIRLEEDNNVSITDTKISDTDEDGINFDDRNTVTIARTEISETGLNGIFFDNNNTVRVADTEISDTGGSGIIFLDGNIVTVAGIEISDTGGSGIRFIDGNLVTVTDTEISNTGDNGIQFDNNNTVSIADTGISETDSHGIFFLNNNVVTIADTQINNTGFGFSGIFFDEENTVTIVGTAISNVGDDGLFFDDDNTVSLNNSTFSGNFGDDVIDINGSNNTLSGGGNVFNGTFGNQFCEVTGAQNGNFNFDQAPQPTCP